MIHQIVAGRVQSKSDRIAVRFYQAHNARGMTVSDRIRARLRDALTDRKLSQRAVADRLQKFTGETWSQPKVGKVLKGKVKLKVDAMVVLADLVGISLVELVRDPGREFVADLTPTELKIVTAMREHPGLQDTIETMIKWRVPPMPPKKPSREVIRERMRRDR